MFKVCLTAFCWLFCFGAIAQSSSNTAQDTGHAGLSINIAVSNDEDTNGDSYFAQAEMNEKRGELNDALTLFGKAAFEYNSNKKFNAYGAALMKLSSVHLMLNNFVEAEQVILNVALKNFSRIGNRPAQMDAYQQLGNIYFAANKLTQSLWFYTQHGIMARQLKNNPAYIDSMLGIIKIKIKKKEYSMALKDVNRAELFARAHKVSQYNAQFKSTRSLLKGKIVPGSKRI